MSFSPAGRGRHFAAPVVYHPVRNAAPSQPMSSSTLPPEQTHGPSGGHFSDIAPPSLLSTASHALQSSLTGVRGSLSCGSDFNASSRGPRSPPRNVFKRSAQSSTTTCGISASVCSAEFPTSQDASSQLVIGKGYGVAPAAAAPLPPNADGVGRNPPGPLWAGDRQPGEGFEREERNAYEWVGKTDEFPEPELLRTFRDKCSPINGVAFSPDMQCMYTSSDDCSLHIYSLQKGVCTRVLHANKYGVHSIRILPHSLVGVSSTSASSPSSAGASGTHGIQPPLQPPPGGAPGVTCLCLCGTRASAPASTSNAAGNRPAGSAAKSQSQVGKGKMAEESGPDAAGSRAPVASGSTAFAVRLWDLAENRYLRTFPLNGKVCRGNGLCLHPQRNIFACCSEDATVRLFALDKEQPMWSRAVRTSTPLAAFDNSGLVLAVYEGEGLVTFFDSKHPYLPFLRFSIAPALRGACPGQPGSWRKGVSAACRRCSLPLRSGQTKAEGGGTQGADSQKMVGYCHCSDRGERSRPALEGEVDVEEQPTSMLFSPDDSEIVVGTSDERLLFFDATTGELVRVLSSRKRGLPHMGTGASTVQSVGTEMGNSREVRRECKEEQESDIRTRDSSEKEKSGRGCWSTQCRTLGEIVQRQLAERGEYKCSGKRQRTDGNEEEQRDHKRKRSSEVEEKLDSVCSVQSCSGSCAASSSSSPPASNYPVSRSKTHADPNASFDASSLFNISPPPFGCSSSCPDCSSVVSSASPLPGEASSRPVFVPAFSPCGRFIAVGGTDRRVHIFDLHANSGKGREAFALGRCESDPQFVLFNSKFDVFLTAGLNASLWKHHFCRTQTPSLLYCV
ncbi:WD domain, G-beta repeat-containing protein [Toxoplasma gondii VAND]|uniref:WD domain, G-beta repeat-containing protein n=2 Tax=Toxoplasma gondii TaxID=5811 RepID=A0A086PML6_TOXGO|nr:WD domain, G-beta repeat-containing protein [Toxoplasma gondii MAS]KFH02843.1 WD domain, G-beta repeat-containing protein [Toxoplasma gondii VAND]